MILTPARWAAGLSLLAALWGCRAQKKSGAKPSVSSLPSSERLLDGKAEWQRLVDNWKYPDPIPNFELVDQEGNTFRLHSVSDGYLLVGFFFTTCTVPDACPLTTKKMREVSLLWNNAPEAGKRAGCRLRLLSLTLDPENDTPAVLKNYARAYGVDLRNWTFATGPEKLLSDGLPSLFGVLALPRRGGSIGHTVKAALLTPGLVSLKEWEDNRFEPSDVVNAVTEHCRSRVR